MGPQPPKTNALLGQLTMLKIMFLINMVENKGTSEIEAFILITLSSTRT